MTPDTRKKLIKWSVAAARIIIGAVFVISGLSKDIDLWGTVYKIEEYLHIWGISEPRTIVFMAALLLSGTEFILGALLLLGCCRRWVPIFLTAVMAVMLPLSLYIYIANPVSDCGCFGDFWVISNAATFWKNVVITAAVIFLIRYNRCLAPWFTPYVQWLVITLVAAYFLVIGLYGYNIQPMVDFRSFPAGANLLPDNDTEVSESADDSITFLYEKDGIRKEFTLDALPDSTWTYVDREEPDHTGREVTELAVYDLDGSDATREAVSAEGEEMILVIPQIQRAEISWTYFLNEMNEALSKQGGRMVAIVGGDDTAAEGWSDISMATYPVYTAEPTTLKELVRGNMGLVFIKDGKIVWKRSMAMMDTSVTDAMLFEENKPESFTTDGGAIFRWLTVVLILSLLILYILDSTGRLLSWRLRVRRMARSDNQTTDNDSSI